MAGTGPPVRQAAARAWRAAHCPGTRTGLCGRTQRRAPAQPGGRGAAAGAARHLGRNRQRAADRLPGLGNRSKLARDLPQDLARARAAQGRLALLFIDLDNFKDINDTLGHQVGDLLLRQLALRLQASVMPPAWVTRHGGDE
ncbi:diguanylate cyclase domain-containing protein, partial [Marinobacter sp.]|uniref:diguanylate cyclase domain-containing protein n=1 Tax=Marinobacter sp. TaxID=50741 RepID=UPI0035C783E0